MNKLEKEILKNQALQTYKINKYEDILTLSETNMLNLLNRNCLLLDIREEVDKLGNKKLVAYDLERKCIYTKLIKGKEVE